MNKRAVIYTRVSTDEQAERGTSLQSQLEACRLMLERELNRLNAEAETRCGLAPIEPAPQDRQDRSQGHAHA